MCRSLLVIVPDFSQSGRGGQNDISQSSLRLLHDSAAQPDPGNFEPPTDHYYRAQAWLVLILIHLWDRRVVLGSLSFMARATRRSRGIKPYMRAPPLTRFTKVWAEILNVGPSGWCRLGCMDVIVNQSHPENRCS